MPEPIVIPCELTITPGGQSRQNRLRLSVSVETVFDEYERELSGAMRQVVSQITAAHARLLTKYAADVNEGK